MSTSDLSNSETGYRHLPQLKLPAMFRLGLFQVGLGMMSVLPDGVLNRVLIKELGVPATIASLILAMTLFVAPARIWFGQMSDAKKLWGYHRTGYAWIGIISMAIMAIVTVQLMWQLNNSLVANGWSGETYARAGLLTLGFGTYGLAVSICSTPFATLLVDVSDDDNRSQLVAIDWGMLIGGTVVGAVTIGVLLKKLNFDAEIGQVETAINRLFFIIPAIAVTLAFLATWGMEKKYSRYSLRSQLVNREESITLKRAWRILTTSRQTKIFFIFLLFMTLGLWMQDPVLEPYGGEVFKMEIGATASLNAFWGIGTLVGLVISGFFLVPRIGKQKTAKIGCIACAACLTLVILSGFTQARVALQIALLCFGLGSGILTSGAITLMLDLTAAETAGTFIGAWGLAQAFARGMAKVIGGGLLDLGRGIFGSNLVLAYGLVFILQAAAMLTAIIFLQQVSVQEFRTNAQQAIASVLENERD
ncbi:BCD family MFS transporter [Merismopedia glauca]|uniref:MFS transporter n=1 Tax=Merismopedia glauca CCAP 1448/3 TaxID=1296344 RepID=A0A2T1C3X8_9CYAN|nr:BCD family MFS transporter [Merismopedia glauca]PSB02847.1 MFS transporter [Merismopedia glauca CCAP 1448/3]